jgi:hypothetical protein
MSLIARTYQCDNGGEGEPHRFEVYLESGEHPKFCPQCGAEVDASALPVPARVSIGGSAIARATDQTYRLVESTSEERAKMLADQAGDLSPQARAALISTMKITDMKDGLRQGDVAAKTLPVSAEFSHFERERRALGLPSLTGFGGGFAGMVAPGARVAPTIATGPGQAYAGPGHIALKAIQPEHDARVQDVVSHPTHKPYIRGGLR